MIHIYRHVHTRRHRLEVSSHWWVFPGFCRFMFLVWRDPLFLFLFCFSGFENLQLLAAIERFLDKSWLIDLKHKRGIFLTIPLNSRLDWLNLTKFDIFRGFFSCNIPVQSRKCRADQSHHFSHVSLVRKDFSVSSLFLCLTLMVPERRLPLSCFANRQTGAARLFLWPCVFAVIAEALFFSLKLASSICFTPKLPTDITRMIHRCRPKENTRYPTQQCLFLLFLFCFVFSKNKNLLIIKMIVLLPCYA